VKGYAPLRHHRFGNAFRPLQHGPNYRGFLEQVRDRFFSQPGQSFWLRELFWSIASIDATALGGINELLNRGNAESIRIALQVIDGGPPEFALSQPDFAVQVMEKCRRVDTKLGESAESCACGEFANRFVQPSAWPTVAEVRFAEGEERSAAQQLRGGIRRKQAVHPHTGCRRRHAPSRTPG